VRPKKTRWVECLPGERCFKPKCKPKGKLDGVIVTLDEFEAVRLADLEGMRQVDAAKKLKISRPTFSRIIESGRKKVADALVNLKAIKIEGGCCRVIKKKE
jgi:uncharacterized protein